MMTIGILAIVAVSAAFLGLLLLQGGRSTTWRIGESERNAKERMKANGLVR
jgi:preprotein translocase subunit SecG